MQEVTILLLHLQHGGIEKQTITLANELVKKYKVNIISTYSMKKAPAYDIDENVNITYLIDDAPNRAEFKAAVRNKNIFKILKEGLKSVKLLRNKRKLMINEIKKIKSGAILSTRIEYAEMLSKYANESVIKITQEHLNNDSPQYIKRVQNGFKNLDYLVVLGPGSNENYSKWLKDNKKIKIVEIPNILHEIPKENAMLNNNNIVAVGRFHKEKGFDELILVFKMVSEQIDNATLTLVGDGEEKTILQNIAQELQLKEKIKFTGMVSADEVKKYMLKASIYAMTSHSECLPMVLLEASSVGIPLVAFDVPVGPKAIIKNNENGFLIANRNIKEMAKKIIYLLENQNEKEKMGAMAKKYAEKYLAENVMPLWYEILD